jgi:hypothetical protein
MQPNKVLSKEMHVKNLRDGEVAIYQLIGAGEISPNRKTQDDDPVYKNPSWQSSRTTMVRDIETGDVVMIGNVTGKRPNPAKTKNNNEPEFIDLLSPMKFVNGFLRLTHLDNPTFQYAERHNANQSNPFRDESKKARYFRVDPKRQAIADNARREILADALSWVMTCDKKEIEAINKQLPDGFKLNMDDHMEVIVGKLFDYTQKDPVTVMKASGDKKTIAKITVLEAEKYQIIIWDNDNRTWFFNDEKMEEIHKVPIGKNRVDGLVESFGTPDGHKYYLRVITRLKKFLNRG